MLRLEGVMEIRVLHKQGMSVRRIARKLNIWRPTVRRYLRQSEAPVYGPHTPRSGKFGPFRHILLSGPITRPPGRIPGTVMLREIQSLGYAGDPVGANPILDHLAHKNGSKGEKLRKKKG